MSYSTHTQVFQTNPDLPETEPIRIAAAVLQAGGLVAFPTETVYGLGANAFDVEAVNRIFSAKGRPASDPVIVHLYNLEQLDSVAANIPDLAYQLAERFWPGPLTFVLSRNPRVPANVSAGLDTIAVRMPNHPIPLALFQAANLPVAAPSANRFARPSSTTAQHVLDDLAERVDVILDGGPAVIGLESTIVNLTKTPPTLLRPGGITLEMLRRIIPNIQINAKHLAIGEDGVEAPGMLSKHYSPRAKVLLFTGLSERVITAMQAEAERLLTKGQQVGILTPDDEADAFDHLGTQLYRLGSDLNEISHNLFRGMRELDQNGVDTILVHQPESGGLGAALQDRLLRAAEGHTIAC